MRGKDPAPPVEGLRDLIAGTFGGICGIVAGHPFDTIKVRMQTKHSTASLGVFGTIKKTLRVEGPLGFFKGLPAPIATAAPINAVVFYIYGRAERSVDTRLTPLQQFGAGCVAGAAQCVLATPMELVKIQCQVTRANTRSAFSMAKRILRVNGPRALYQGWWLTCARDIPGFGIYFCSYEYLRVKCIDNGCSTGFASFMSGGTAGALSFLLLHPFDVLKSAHQELRFRLADRVGFTALANRGFRIEGSKYFLRGLLPSMCRAFPVSAVTFLVVEKTLEYI